MPGRPKGRVKQTDTVDEAPEPQAAAVEEPVAPAGAPAEAPPPVRVEELPNARDVRAESVAAPAPQAPADAGREVPGGVQAKAEDLDAEGAAQRAQGEMITYIAKRGGAACNLSLQVSGGVPVERDAHGRIIPGTAVDSKFIHFGPKTGNPQGMYRTSDPDEIALIEKSGPFQAGQITRTDVARARADLAAIDQLAARGIPVAAAHREEIERRAGLGGNAPQVQRGARTTRRNPGNPDHDPGVSKPFAGVDDVLADPRVRGALRRG